MKATQVRLADPLHEELKQRAFSDRTSMNRLVNRAVHLLLHAGSPESLDRWLEANPVPVDEDGADVPGSAP